MSYLNFLFFPAPGDIMRIQCWHMGTLAHIGEVLAVTLLLID